ncbi:MAG: isoleucine--tRNA ligase, partial [Acidimicrobiia bacterium]|nr:isoleucine--tRNA ligase [Acidimicrobiia bacterium]
SSDVNTEEGTGLVHMAPAYGEADFVALQSAGLDVLVDPVDAVGNFTDAVSDVSGMNVKEADSTLIGLLKESGKILSHTQIRHSYPFCWRTETPLIYKAIPTWFVNVEAFRDRMVELNRTIHWVPESVGQKRFGNWLAGARDWAISRNRYWGSCIPVWECDSCDELVCIGSREELQERSGVWLDDLHKHFVDEVTFPCSACDGTAHRVPEVLDCWFESGSMPYAQIHYPFENQDRFSQRFPANFIAEGLDQTRGWFYTLLVLSTALFDEAPFQNCVVTGLILAEDGRKMSKSLKNYPNPVHVLDEFGADALRAYLINSPVVRADPLRFSEVGVREVVRTVLLPLWNAFVFFTTYANADGVSYEDLRSAPPLHQRPEMDRWIVSSLQSLIGAVNDEMEGYRLHAVVPPILGFIDDLTNWYIRRNRRRFWSQRSDATEADKLAAFATLYDVLVTFSTVAAPVIPFITEDLYQRLAVSVDDSAGDSVHLLDYPTVDEPSIDRDLEQAMDAIRTVVNLGRGLRKEHQLRVRQPLRSLTVITRDAQVTAAVASHRELIADELNVKDVVVSPDEGDLLHLSVKPDYKELGPRLGGAVKELARALNDLTDTDIGSLLDGGTLTVLDHEISATDVVVERTPRDGVVVASSGPVAVALDTDVDEELRTEGVAREIISRIQRMRREEALEVTDRIEIEWTSSDENVTAAMSKHADLIADEVLAVSISEGSGEAATAIDVEGATLELRLSRVQSS